MDLLKMVSSVSVLLLALCAFLKEGMAIRCYMCNSAPTRNGGLCDSEALKLKGNDSVFIQDCDQLVREDNRSYTVCRKIHQTIIDNDGDEEDRVIRQCGTDSPLGCSWRTRPNTLQVETCHCTTDLCNHARPAGKPPSARLLFICCTAAVLIAGLFSSALCSFRS